MSVDRDNMDITNFKQRYTYKSDVKDHWTLLDGTGAIHGDCEDFVYTILWIMSGKSWLRFWWMIITCQAMFWWTKMPVTGQGHIMLWMRGYGWIDCNHPDWSAAPHYQKVFPYVAPLLALALTIK